VKGAQRIARAASAVHAAIQRICFARAVEESFKVHLICNEIIYGPLNRHNFDGEQRFYLVSLCKTQSNWTICIIFFGEL
jgi:hypothetical protein